MGPDEVVMLQASHNPLVASPVRIVAAVLEGRVRLMPFEPKQEAIGFHRSMADAVAALSLIHISEPTRPY